MTPPGRQVIRLYAQAPSKPALGAPCNGCGVCCACEPCPVGIVVTRRMRGACRALTWDEAGQRYRCGVVQNPQRYTHWRSAWLNRLLARLALRMIAAGRGCDSTVEVERPLD